MALNVNVNETRTMTGGNAASAKPINDGPQVTVVPEEKESRGLAILDKLVTTTSDTASKFLEAVADREISRVNNSEQVETQVSTVGEVEDQPGGTAGPGLPEQGAKPFFEQNKIPILLGVGLLGLILFGVIIRK